jgi:hypothetical protein
VCLNFLERVKPIVCSLELPSCSLCRSGTTFPSEDKTDETESKIKIRPTEKKRLILCRLVFVVKNLVFPPCLVSSFHDLKPKNKTCVSRNKTVSVVVIEFGEKQMQKQQMTVQHSILGILSLRDAKRVRENERCNHL